MLATAETEEEKDEPYLARQSHPHVPQSCRTVMLTGCIQADQAKAIPRRYSSSGYLNS